MAKRRDHDSTMDLSLSQFVVSRPPKPPVNPNDVSVWGRHVVGSADFAPPPRKRAAHAPLWIGLGVLGTLAIAAAVYVMFMRPSADTQVATATVQEAAAKSVREPTKELTPKPPTVVITALAVKPEIPEKPREQLGPQIAVGALEVMMDPVAVSIRSLVTLMRSAFQGVSSLDPKKPVAQAVAKNPTLKKKPVRAVKRRR